VAHQTFDHASVLKLIEWRFGLKYLTARDKHAANLAEVLDFDSKPKLEAPIWKVPDVTPTPCASPTTAAAKAAHWGEWRALGDLARRHGFDVA
jgi:phospholipase C